MRHHRCRAFTLIEVLVVIGLILLLIGLLLPSIKGAWDQARAVQCRDQMRQVGVALAAYATLSHGVVTPYEVVTFAPPSRRWPEIILGEVSPRVVICPTADDGELLSYMLNFWCWGGRVRLGQPQLIPVTEIVLAGENVRGSNHDYSSSLPDGTLIYDPQRHGRKLLSNYLWLDFHVSNQPPLWRFGYQDPWHVPR